MSPGIFRVGHTGLVLAGASDVHAWISAALPIPDPAERTAAAAPAVYPGPAAAAEAAALPRSGARADAASGRAAQAAATVRRSGICAVVDLCAPRGSDAASRQLLCDDAAAGGASAVAGDEGGGGVGERRHGVDELWGAYRRAFEDEAAHADPRAGEPPVDTVNVGLGAAYLPCRRAKAAARHLRTVGVWRWCCDTCMRLRSPRMHGRARRRRTPLFRCLVHRSLAWSWLSPTHESHACRRPGAAVGRRGRAAASAARAEQQARPHRPAARSACCDDLHRTACRCALVAARPRRRRVGP